MKANFSEDFFLEHINSVTEIKGFSENFRWLSNFAPVEPIIHESISYFTTENFYQAMKTLDKEKRLHISTLTPGKAKRYGNPENGFITVREDWLDIKLSIMEYALREKFAQDFYKRILLATGDMYIEETNTWNDQFFGCTPDGVGLNHLGKLIMQIRKDLQNGIYLPATNFLFYPF